MRNREQIYGQEAAGLLRNITVYHCMRRDQLLRLYPGKESIIENLLRYAQSIESNLMQMILAKEKLNLFMKGDETDMDDIYERFGVDYDLTSLLLYRDIDEDGRFSIRWGEQEIA